MAQNRTGRIFAREIGMALAVLALWMLSLLSPLHQASSVLREAAKTGHDISGAWSICISLAQDQDHPERQLPVCPAQGIGKGDIALPPPPVALTGFVPLTYRVVVPQRRLVSRPASVWLPGQPRAPPPALA